jgi:hypothetical protein
MLTRVERNVKVGEDFKIYLFSDLHIDSPDCDRKRLKQDLDQALKENNEIIINGDVFDFLLFRDAKRSTPSNQANINDDQIGTIIDSVFDFLKPYAKLIIGIGVGNHETSVIKYHHIDPVKMLIYKLEKECDTTISHLGYAGFIRLSLKRPGVSKGLAYDIWYHHGAGGGGKSKGIMQHNDVASNFIADLYWMGHNHANLADFDYPITYITQKGNVETKNRMFARTAGYQRNDNHGPEDYKQRGYKLDWGKEKFLRSTSKGCQILTLKLERETINKTEYNSIRSRLESGWN